MLNNITIQGRLVRDPEVRYTQDQKAVCSFTIACDRDYRDKKTDFIDIVAWENTADFVQKYFHKGSTIFVNGRLQIREWTDKQDNRRRAAEIVASACYFGDSKKPADDWTALADEAESVKVSDLPF